MVRAGPPNALNDALAVAPSRYSLLGQRQNASTPSPALHVVVRLLSLLLVSGVPGSLVGGDA